MNTHMHECTSRSERARFHGQPLVVYISKRTVEHNPRDPRLRHFYQHVIVSRVCLMSSHPISRHGSISQPATHHAPRPARLISAVLHVSRDTRPRTQHISACKYTRLPSCLVTLPHGPRSHVPPAISRDKQSQYALSVTHPTPQLQPQRCRGVYTTHLMASNASQSLSRPRLKQAVESPGHGRFSWSRRQLDAIFSPH